MTHRVFGSLLALTICAVPATFAQAAPTVQIAKIDATPRVLVLHRTVLGLLPAVQRGAHHRGDGSVSTRSSKTPCGLSGSVTATLSVTATTTSGGSGAVTYTFSFTNCKTPDSGGNSLDGNVAFTFSSSSDGGTGSTTTINYLAGAVTLSGSVGAIEPQNLTIATRTLTTPSVGGDRPKTTITNTIDGQATISGTPFKYVREALK